MLVKLICMHYGGGNRFSFLKLKEHLSSSIKMESLEIPGHGKRIKEPLLTDLELMAEDLYEQIKGELPRREPVILYGHSLGGMLLFLLMRLLRSRGHTMPYHLVISGCKAPQFNHIRDTICHELSDEAFKLKLKDLGGFPKEVLDNEELIAFFLPILRADFKAIETYKYTEERPLDIPLTVIAGLDEKISKNDLLGWQKETVHPIKLLQFPGNHFFILEKFNEIGNIINKISNQILIQS